MQKILTLCLLMLGTFFITKTETYALTVLETYEIDEQINGHSFYTELSFTGESADLLRVYLYPNGGSTVDIDIYIQVPL